MLAIFEQDPFGMSFSPLINTELFYSDQTEYLVEEVRGGDAGTLDTSLYSC